MAGPIIDRLSRDMWIASGSKSARKRAKEQASKLVNKGSLRPIDDILAKELEDVSIKHL